MIYRFTIPGQPIGKGRARAFAFRSKKTQKINVRMYTPDKTTSWEDRAVHYIRDNIGSPKLEGPLRIDILAVFERPKAMRSKKIPDRREWHIKKPDRDNVEKIIYDAMKKAGVFVDDCQVCDGETRKFTANKREQPYVEVSIYTLNDMDLPASALA